ncbi:MAG: iron ABC transporter permease [Victivallaceae bacterium]|nr:iron ABC transporter permease [Victivallaceae bacterium]
MTRRALCYLAMVAVAAFLVLFLVVPVGMVTWVGCDADLMRELFRSRTYVEGMLNSVKVAVTTTGMVFAISIVLATCYDRYDFPGRRFCPMLMMVPMVLPPFVGALGYQRLLGHFGVVNAMLSHFGVAPVDFLSGSGCFWSICLIEALHLYPVFYLNLVSALGNIDPNHLRAAANLGAGWARRFFRITLPLVSPGILAGGSLVFVWSLTELGTPLMFNYLRVTPVQILDGLGELEGNKMPFALVFVVFVATALLYLAARMSLSRCASAGKGRNASAPSPLPAWRGRLVAGMFWFVTFCAALPHLMLLLTAFSRVYYGTVLPQGFTLYHFREAQSNALVLPSVVNSLKYSLSATAISLVAGLVTSLATSRWKLVGSRVVDMASMLPLAVPGVVLAFGYVAIAFEAGLATGHDAASIALGLLVISYAVRRMPYVVRSVSAGLEQTPIVLEDAARNLGAGPWTVLRRITVPLVLANIMVGALFAFGFSMLEVSDSLILAQRVDGFPITKALYELARILGSGPDTACAFGVWMMFFLGTTLAFGCVLLGRKIGAAFRM